MRIRKVAVNLAILSVISTAGCGTTERDWKRAKDANTASGYTDFLTKHPKGTYANDARAAIEEIDWNSARAKNTAADYNKYIQTYSSGKHAAEAKAGIDAIEGATYIPLDLPCGARVSNMGFTFFGTPSGDLVGFECRDKKGETVNIKLKSKKFTDGKIETTDFGVILMKMNGMSAGYEILQSQMKKLQVVIGSGTVAR
jgi:hypothetical protein